MKDGEGFFDNHRKQQMVNHYLGQPQIQSEKDLTDQETITENDTDNDINKQSVMPVDSSHALVTLLKYGVILYDEKSKLFESVCTHQIELRGHLSNMYLDLILDEQAGVAFIANSNGEKTISLITQRTLTLYDTLLLIVLRKYYKERETAGEQKIIVDIERIESNLYPFQPITNNGKSDRKKLNAAIQRMIKKRLLSSVVGNDNRYKITPVIKYVVKAEFLENMLNEYEKLANEATTLI